MSNKITDWEEPLLDEEIEQDTTQVLLMSLLMYTGKLMPKTERDIAALNYRNYSFFSPNEKTREHLEALCRRGYIKKLTQECSDSEQTDSAAEELPIDSAKGFCFDEKSSYYMPSEVFYTLNKIHV